MKISINKGFKRAVTWLTGLILVFVSIGFAEREKDNLICGEVIIRITNQFENYFIDEEDLMSIITREGNLSIVGNYLDNLDLKSIETSLKDESFIKDAQVYKDLKGNIIVTAEQRRPAARISRPGVPDAYIDEEGTILPVSEKFTSRVLLITGDYTKRLVEEGITENNRNYMQMITMINADPFWKAQIAQLDIDASGEINIYPQVTKQVVEFGLPVDLELKFKKLQMFYKKILPFKGWNTYQRVNLKYKDQIICE